MMRGTFANVRIKNLMLPPRPTAAASKAAITLLQPGRADADLRRGDEIHRRGTPTVVFAGEEYGTGPVARLGGEGHAAARRESGHRAESTSASTAATWSAWACCRCSSRATTNVAALASERRRNVRHQRHRRQPEAAAGRDADHPAHATAARSRCRCCCASTRRSRWTITGTAGYCPMC